MIVTGPYALEAGQILQVNDPSINSASSSVQVQNNSGFSLLIIDGNGGQSQIGPNIAATFPSYGGATITLQVVGSGLAATGVSLVWLLPQDTNPQPDGQIVGVINANISGIETQILGTYSLPGGGSTGVALPSWASSIELSWGSGFDPANLGIVGNVTGFKYVDPSYSFPTIPPYFFNLLGPDIALTVSYNASSAGTLYLTAIAQISQPTSSQFGVQVYNAAPASGTDAGLLPAPAAGYIWLVSIMQLYTQGSPESGGYIAIKGALSGAFYLVGFANPNGINAVATPTELYISEELLVSNHLTVTGNGLVVVRPVVANAQPPVA